jgi:uncharacterized membrane protein YkvA (DUF1232 family)
MNELKKYENEYSEKSLINKVVSCGKKMGLKLIYMCLILYYTIKDPKVPMKIKSIVISALGYVIAPIDLIFDGIPSVGYVDDLATVTIAFVMITSYVTPEIKNQAKNKLVNIFGDTVDKELAVIELEVYDELNN